MIRSRHSSTLCCHAISRIARSGVLVMFAWSGMIFSQQPPQQEGPGLPPLPHPEIPTPPEFHPPQSPWLIVGASVILLMFVGMVIWLLTAKRKTPAAPEESPVVEANRRLRSLLAECDQIPPASVAHFVSVILRDYQNRRYHIPAPFQTSEEIFRAPPASAPGTSAERTTQHFQRFEPLARIYDRLEFAPQIKTASEARSLVEDSIKAIREECLDADLVLGAEKSAS